jgi:hypothetical protein
MTYPRISLVSGFTSCSADAMEKSGPPECVNTRDGPDRNVLLGRTE